MKALLMLLICAGPMSSGANLTFPSHFKFGAATAAYQIEGGWNADDKGESIWDRICHMKPSPIANNDTGDVAADSYHRWREDVAIAVEMGLQSYRFSIAWPRLLPSGFPNRVSSAGARYYSDLIDALLGAGIEPVVTLYHWELPVAIHDLGGWTNPLIVDWFGDYARIVYSLYADRVKTWLTINEPVGICDFSYNLADYASLIKEPVFAPFLCNKFILLAHARAYRIYDEEFKPKYYGRISLANNVMWMEPLTPGSKVLAETARQLMIGRYSHPIFSKEGGWPASVEKLMLKHSLIQGYNKSRLPSFTEEEKKYIQGWQNEQKAHVMLSATFAHNNHNTTQAVAQMVLKIAFAKLRHKDGKSHVIAITPASVPFYRNTALQHYCLAAEIGTADYYGLNYYITYTIRPVNPGERPDLWFISSGPELGAVLERPRNASYGAVPILPIYPEGLRKMLLWLKKQYGSLDFFIVENGYTSGLQLDDYGRIDFIKEHLEQILLSIREDDVNVTGYLVWSMIDNFEWRVGYGVKFGLYQVDFTDPERKRTPRASAEYYTCIIKSRSLNETCRKLQQSKTYLSSRGNHATAVMFNNVFINTVAILICLMKFF